MGECIPPDLTVAAEPLFKGWHSTLEIHSRLIIAISGAGIESGFLRPRRLP